MRFCWLWFSCLLPLLSLSVLTPAALAEEGPRPNIVLIMADDKYEGLAGMCSKQAETREKTPCLSELRDTETAANGGRFRGINYILVHSGKIRVNPRLKYGGRAVSGPLVRSELLAQWYISNSAMDICFPVCSGPSGFGPQTRT